MVKIGIIGGSGLDDPGILEDFQEKTVETPYGYPTSSLTIGKLRGVDVVLIARHGKQHTYPPTHVNFRANIHALKEEGCTHILATTACGSLRRDIARGDFVVLDQFIDFTRLRPVSFYEEFEPHNAKHTLMADPFNEELRQALIKTAKELDIKHHEKGTVVTIEGARFSTRAESRMFSGWGADVINMSIAPEAILANEAGIPYAAVAMSTDFDCLFDDVPPVSWEEILETFGKNVGKVKQLIMETVPKIR